jgi:hypothetical protein|tara:strand:- start:1344 stop:1469 length:126 start_codon:yes stop_codon:yes gene_type:complete
MGYQGMGHWRVRVDCEGRLHTAQAFIKIVGSHLLLNRLQPA